MKKIFAILQVVLIAITYSCYKDKGNYDYIDMEELIIENIPYQHKNIGEEIEIIPKLNRDISKYNYYTFKWSINDYSEADWNKLNFKWKANKIIDKGLITLEITDERYGVKYIKATGCEITPIFDAPWGWLTLSDKDGVSQLSLFHYVDYEMEEEVIIPKKVKEYFDATKRELNYELGKGPIGFQVYSSKERNTKGQIFVMQESGAVDIGGISLEKDFDVAQLFDGGIVPDNSYITSCTFMEWVNALTDAEGRLYTRVKSTNQLFHSNLFMNEPVEYNEEILKDCELVRSAFSRDGSKHSLIIDRNKGRLLAINDGNTYFTSPLTNAAKIMELNYDVSDAPEGWIALNNLSNHNIKSVEWFRVYKGWGKSYSGYGLLLENKESKELSLQTFVVERDGNRFSSLSSTIKNTIYKKVYPIEGIGTPSLMCIPTAKDSEYAFFVVENKIYLLDRSNQNDPIKLFITLPSKITAIESDDNSNSQMGVGLMNGAFYILDIRDAKNTAQNNDNEKILYQSNEGEIGRIIDIKRKVQASWYY